MKKEIAEEGGNKTVWIKPFKCFFLLLLFVCETAETSPICVIVLPQQKFWYSETTYEFFLCARFLQKDYNTRIIRNCEKAKVREKKRVLKSFKGPVL